MTILLHIEACQTFGLIPNTFNSISSDSFQDETAVSSSMCLRTLFTPAAGGCGLIIPSIQFLTIASKTAEAAAAVSSLTCLRSLFEWELARLPIGLNLWLVLSVLFLTIASKTRQLARCVCVLYLHIEA
jgi:hypothetical protein